MTRLLNILMSTWAIMGAGGAGPAVARPSQEEDNAAKVRYQVMYVDPFVLRDDILGEGVDVEIRVLSDGSLDFTGNSQEVHRAKLVAKRLDVPSNAPNYHEQTVQRIPLKHYAAAELARVLAASINTAELRIAVDERSNSLLAGGTSGKIQKLLPIIAEMDTPKQSLRIEFYFIRGTIGGETQPPSPSLPRALQPVAASLADAGFHGLQLIAPIQILTEDGSSQDGKAFSQSTSLDVPHTEGKVYRYRFEVVGSAQVLSAGDVARILVQAEASGQEVTSDGRVPQTTLDYQVSTRVSAALGQYVVLSAAPGTTPFGNAFALVLKVER